jgi:hypothetical protein
MLQLRVNFNVSLVAQNEGSSVRQIELAVPFVDYCGATSILELLKIMQAAGEGSTRRKNVAMQVEAFEATVLTTIALQSLPSRPSRSTS